MPLHQFLKSPSNINILRNGEAITKDFMVQIGYHSYVVQNLLSVWGNLYCYQGYQDGNGIDVVLIKVFSLGSASSYYEELDRAVSDEATILLDKDDKHRILVEKYGKPFTVTIGNSHFVLTQELAVVPERLVYLGHRMNDDISNPLIMKFYSRDENGSHYYQREKDCMENLERLVAFDESNHVIVEKYIPGILLSDALSDDSIDRDLLFEQCKLQLDRLHRKLKVSHNNIQPYNIIVNENGDVNFLDYSKTKKLSSDESEASRQRLNDMKDLLWIFRRKMERIASAPF